MGEIWEMIHDDHDDVLQAFLKTLSPVQAFLNLDLLTYKNPRRYSKRKSGCCLTTSAVGPPSWLQANGMEQKELPKIPQLLWSSWIVEKQKKKVYSLYKTNVAPENGGFQ